MELSAEPAQVDTTTGEPLESDVSEKKGKKRKSKSKLVMLPVPVLPHDKAVRDFLELNFAKPQAFYGDMTAPLASFLYHEVNTRNRGIVIKAEAAYEADIHSELWIGPTPDAIGIAFIRGDEIDYLGNLDRTPGLPTGSNGKLLRDPSGKFVRATSGSRIALINGQHRAAAFARAEATFPVLFAIGLPLAARSVTDQNQGRKSAEEMHMEGISEPRRSDALVRALDALQQRMSRKLSPPFIAQYIDEWRSEIAWSLKAVPANRVTGTPQIAAAFAYVYRATANDPAARDRLIQAAEALRTGAKLAEDSPMKIFRDYCNKRLQKSVKWPRRPTWVLSLQTLNALALEVTEKVMTPRKHPGPFSEANDGFDFFLGSVAGRDLLIGSEGDPATSS